MAKKMTTDEMQADKAKAQTPTSEGATAAVSGKVEELKVFFEESKSELKKITWPTKKEIRATGIAVLILVVVMAIFLGVVDALLSKLVQFFLT